MHSEREDRSEDRANDEPLTPFSEAQQTPAFPTDLSPRDFPSPDISTDLAPDEAKPMHAVVPDSIPSAAHISPPADEASQGSTSDFEEPSLEIWLDGENKFTLLLRAITTLLCGGFLAWAQYQVHFQVGTEWGRWVRLSVIANLLLPTFVVWMFFAQQFRHAEWLPDQKYNAWQYGWNFRAWRRHGAMALAMFAVMLPFIWWAARDPAARSYYATYFPQPVDATSWLWLLSTLTLYMFCWEWFNRGFMLFGMAQGFGPWLAIFLQAVVFAAAHYGKPQAEFIGAFAGGLILGIIAWREKSFAPAFYTHALVHGAWAIFVLR